MRQRLEIAQRLSIRLSDDPGPGTHLGPYEIVSQLGQGGMGVVYKAHDPRLDRHVAIKLLPADLTRDETAKQRFQQEAKAASTLDHPNICTIHEINETDDSQLYLVMAHYEGETLKERITRGPLETGDAVDIATQVGQGLAKAHGAGIVHRDIKPANLMVTADGTVKILDFGLAKLAGTEGVTQTGTMVGTVASMSPESAKGQEVDHRTDIWALGVVLYEMLSGQPPFQGENLLTLADAIRDREPRELSGLSASLQPVAAKALGKTASQRYQAIDDLLRDLRATKSGMDISPAAVAGPGDIPSIAVLPFTNMSADPDQDYFSDGLTEEVIADLSKIRGLRVISRTSVMQLKGTHKDLQTIGQELNVGYVLEGSVRRVGNKLRVTAQLIDARTDAHLWAEKYAGTLDDVFEIQERLSCTIVEALKVTLTPEEAQQMAERPIDDPRAYACYLQATQEIYHISEESLDRAVQLAQNGLDIIGENELLYTTMGHACVMQTQFGIKPDEPSLSKAERCAERAFAVNPSSRHGLRLLGMVHYKRGERVESARLFKRALAAEPYDYDALLWLSTVYLRAGHAGPARPLVEKFREIDPLNPFSHQLPGVLDFMEGKGAGALLAAHRRAYEMAPGSPYCQWVYAWALAYNLRFSEACSVLDRLARDAAGTGPGRYAVFFAAALRQDHDAALAAVTDELTAWAKADDMASFFMSDGFAVLDMTDEVLTWLDRAMRFGWANYPFLAELDPLLQTARGDPRFQNLLARVRTVWENFDA